VDWLVLAGLGIMWMAFLMPTGRRGQSPHQSVEDFGRRMELLAQAEAQGAGGRWIVTPRKGVRFVGTVERRRARARERRRQVFTFLLESIALSFLIGLVPPLRSLAWGVTIVLGVTLLLYVWLLLTLKRSASSPVEHEAVRASRVPAARSSHAAQARYVAEGRSTWARPTFNGLGTLGESDRVHVVVRTADPAGA
jgi:hypothetical protein